MTVRALCKLTNDSFSIILYISEENERTHIMLFFKKSNKQKDTMPLKAKMALDKRPLKYVTMRDSETYKEIRLGENGAVNIMEGDFVLVCQGKDVMRCDLEEVRVAELMNLSGITVKGFDKTIGKEKSVIAYFADKF